jgi:hypothetical protein
MAVTEAGCRRFESTSKFPFRREVREADDACGGQSAPTSTRLGPVASCCWRCKHSVTPATNEIHPLSVVDRPSRGGIAIGQPIPARARRRSTVSLRGWLGCTGHRAPPGTVRARSIPCRAAGGSGVRAIPLHGLPSSAGRGPGKRWSGVNSTGKTRPQPHDGVGRPCKTGLPERASTGVPAAATFDWRLDGWRLRDRPGASWRVRRSDPSGPA